MFRRRRRADAALAGLPGSPARKVRRASRVGLALGVVVGLLAVGTPTVAAAEPAPADDPDRSGVAVERAVSDELAAHGAADFWVIFDQAADLSGADAITDWAERGRYVYRKLTAAAQASQAGLLAELAARGVEHEAFWIANAVLVRGGDAATLDAARLELGVAEIRAQRTYSLPDPIEEETTSPDAELDAVEWGIANIRADQVWDTFDVTGEGIVVGNIDSGVSFDHPALVNQYRGNLGAGGFDHDYNWWDPSAVCPAPEPCDNDNHGTHTMGTMVGDDGAGNQIGVAPGARWIAAKGCESRTCSDSALLSSAQFMLAPTDLAGENPRPELRPHVVNNSWGDPNRSAVNPFYRQVVTAWTAAGIFGVFSNGNEGPGCDTTGSPADYLESWSVGAYDVNNTIAGFSSRGPGEDGQIRPNLSAPGVAVRSSLANGGYGLGDGTSMAAPHQSGAVALIWSAALTLTGQIAQTRQLLAQTAVDTDNTSCGGTAENNNVYGEGRLDAFAAVEQAPRGPTGILAGTVSNGASGTPVGGAAIAAATGDDTFTTTTHPDGTYLLRLPVGTHTVTAQAHGYLERAVTGVQITEDQTTTQDFPLDPVPIMAVNPPELTSWQHPDETISHTFTIGNDGAADLEWSIADDGAACGSAGTPLWVTVDPPTGSVAPGEEQTVAVTFDSADLPDGEVLGDICVVGNDPSQPSLVVVLTLLVDVNLPETWVQRDKLTPSDRTATIDRFGSDVAIDGDTAVALACDVPGGSSAYVYTRSDDGVWRESAKLAPSSEPRTSCGFFLGGSVAIDGDTVVLGLPNSDTAEGSVTVFARSGDEWTEQAHFTGFAYGIEVEVDGDTAFTTAFIVDEQRLTFHVFERDGTNWSMQAEFTWPDNAIFPPGPLPKLDADGDTAVINRFAVEGAPEGSWRAAIFTRSGEEWIFEAELTPSDVTSELAFAEDEVSLDGDTAVVAARREDGPASLGGAAYVFTRGSGGWSQQQKLVVKEGGGFAWRSVAVDDDRIMVGSDFGAGTPPPGAVPGVHVWNQVGQVWRHHATLVPGGPPGRFGRSVAFDGDTAIISATPNHINIPPFFPASNGPVYIFDTDEPAPTPDVKPASADFGAVIVDEVSDSKAMLVENNGSADLEVGKVSLAGEHPGDFLVTDDDCSGQAIPSGAACTFEVRFTPGRQSLGPRTANVSIPSNASTAPDSVSVAGEGLPAPPAVDVSPDRLVAEVAEGSRLTKPLLLSNGGTLDLEWSIFPDPDATEGLTLHSSGETTMVATSPVGRSLTGSLARITTGDSAAALGETVTPTSEVAAPGTVTLSHSRSLELTPGNTARCSLPDGTSADNRYLRTFTLPDFSVMSDLEVTQVSFGVENLTIPAEFVVNLHVLNGDDFTYANLDRLATTTVSLQPQSQTLVSVPVSTVVPAGSTVVLEVAAPDLRGLGSFSAGSNPGGETAPSYLSSTVCGAPEPTPYSRIGFPNTHLVMTVGGTVDCGASWLAVDPDGGTVAGGDTQLAEVTLDPAGLAPGGHTGNLCLASNDPMRQLATVPVALEVTEREPVTFDSLRDRVQAFEDSGEVTSAGAKRLTMAVDKAEDHHERGKDDKAVKALQEFQRLAGKPTLVPSPEARDALIADAEQLIGQLREALSDPGATAPVAGQHVLV